MTRFFTSFFVTFDEFSVNRYQVLTNENVCDIIYIENYEFLNKLFFLEVC